MFVRETLTFLRACFSLLERSIHSGLYQCAGEKTVLNNESERETVALWWRW